MKLGSVGDYQEHADKPEQQSSDLAGAKVTLFTWAETIARRNVAEVMALYAVDAILVPTLSNEIGDREENADSTSRRFSPTMSCAAKSLSSKSESAANSAL